VQKGSGFGKKWMNEGVINEAKRKYKLKSPMIAPTTTNQRLVKIISNIQTQQEGSY
jgi:hypothetical protein